MGVQRKGLEELIGALRDEYLHQTKAREAFAKEVRKAADKAPGKAHVSQGSYPGQMVVTVPSNLASKVTS